MSAILETTASAPSKRVGAWRATAVRAPRASVPRTRLRLAPGPRIRLGLALGPVLLLILWVVASAFGLVDARVLSAPWAVVVTALELVVDGRLPAHLGTSAGRAFTGLALGLGVGSVLAVLSGLTRLGEALIDGPVQIKRAVPTLALIPLLILWLGIGEPMKVITIALAVAMPVYIHTQAALRAIDARHVELAESLALRRGEFIRRVALPGALPGFFMGLRLGVTSSWLSLVVVEQINATSGIGYMMSLARSYGQTEVILVGLVVYGLFGLGSDWGVRRLERRALAWRRTLAG